LTAGIFTAKRQSSSTPRTCPAFGLTDIAGRVISAPMDVACCPSRGVSTRRRRHAAYAIATSALSALATLVNILPVLRDRLQIYLGIDDRGFGLLLAAAPLAGVAGVIIAGILVGRIGPVAMIRRSLQGLAAGMLLLAASGPRWGFALSSCTLCGLCAGALNIATVTYLTRLFPREQRRILALSLAITTGLAGIDRKSTRLNSSHANISYAWPARV